MSNTNKPSNFKKIDKVAASTVLISVAALVISILSGWDKISIWFGTKEISISLPERLHLINHMLCRPNLQTNVTLRNATVSDLKLSKLEIAVVGPSKRSITLAADLILPENFNAAGQSIRGQKIKASDTWSANVLFNELDEPGYREAAGNIHFLINSSLDEYEIKNQKNPSSKTSQPLPIAPIGIPVYYGRQNYAEVSNEVKAKASKFCDDNIARYLPGEYKLSIRAFDEKGKIVANTNYRTTILEKNLEFIKVNFATTNLFRWGQKIPPSNVLSYTVPQLLLEIDYEAR
jgi:hypothetical protein